VVIGFASADPGKMTGRKENSGMNEDILLGKWNQLKGEVRQAWGRLTDDDVQRIEGSREKLSGILQERYGYTKDQALENIANFLELMESKFGWPKEEKTPLTH
jgi:uncharacterized protein YjbJ (UPF0337 family)